MGIRTLVTLLTLVTVPRVAVADDLQLWTKAGVRLQVTDTLRLQFDQHARFDEDVSAAQSFMPELALSVRALKFLRLTVGYRFIAEPMDGYVESWHRVFGDVRLRYRLKPLTVRYRLRLQEQFGFPWPDEELTAKHTVRNKIKVELNVSDVLEPFIFGELFNRIVDADGPWHKVRLGAGISGIIDGHQLTLSYRMESSLADDARETRQIVAMGYHVDLP